MSDKTIKHFIFSRFFPRQDPKYPYDVLDVNFLSKQLVMANNMLRSLENQTNKNFELVFIANPMFFDNPKYEFVFSTLQASTALPLKFIKNGNVPRLVKKAYEKYDFVIQSKMDFDDFIYKDAIAETQNKVSECDSLLVYGYCKGYQYYKGDLAFYNHFWNGIGHIGILQSLIMRTSLAKNLPLVDVNRFSHHVFKLRLEKFLEDNGLEFSESMFQQNTSINAYIYFKHDFSHNNLVSNPCNLEARFQKIKKLTNTDDITKQQLEDEFGFFYDLNSIK